MYPELSVGADEAAWEHCGEPAQFDITLKLPGQPEPIRARGTVRWIREFSETSDTTPGMGLRLVMNDRDLPRVRRFLSTRPPLFFDED